MNSLDTVIASLPSARVSVGGLLNRLHRQGRLRPLLLATLAERLVQQQAQQEGLSISVEELQAAADCSRGRQGLHTAADTHAWLQSCGLSVDDFEADLEESLLAGKLKQHLTAGRVEEYFASHQDEYERLRLAQLLVARDDLARELASQVRDEGRDLEDIARDNGLRVVQRQLFRKQLVGPLAEALAEARTGELVGPLRTTQGFVLVILKQRQPPGLDPTTRQSIQNELFARWLADQMKEATFDLTVGENG